MASASVQHPPAVKVGGRRLSITARHTKGRPTADTSKQPSSETDQTPQADNSDDYPRPAAAPAEGQVDDTQDRHNTQHEDETPLKKDKKHNQLENEKRLKELAHRKIESTRPTRDAQSGSKSFGAAGRIAQPAGKGLAV